MTDGLITLVSALGLLVVAIGLTEGVDRLMAWRRK